MKKFIFKFIFVAIALGVFSPTLRYTPSYEGIRSYVDISDMLSFDIFAQAEARRGGGARRGGMRRSSFNRSRMSSPRSNRYYGGSFQRSRPSARPTNRRSNFSSSRPNKSFTRQTRPAQRPNTRPIGSKPNKSPFKPSTRPVNRPSKPITKPNRPGKPSRPGINPPVHGRPPHGKPPHGRPPHGKPPHHGHPRPPHHGHPHHGHHHHYYPYYGGYWPWFWGSAIVVGAIVSTVPDNDCHDIKIDGKLYKECEGVLFEPVYSGDEVNYKVVKIDKK